MHGKFVFFCFRLDFTFVFMLFIPQNMCLIVIYLFNRYYHPFLSGRATSPGPYRYTKPTWINFILTYCLFIIIILLDKFILVLLTFSTHKNFLNPYFPQTDQHERNPYCLYLKVFVKPIPGQLPGQTKSKQI